MRNYFFCFLFAFLPKEVLSEGTQYEQLPLYFQLIEKIIIINNGSIQFEPKRLSDTESSPLYYGVLRKCLDNTGVQMLSAAEAKTCLWGGGWWQSCQSTTLELDTKVEKVESIYYSTRNELHRAFSHDGRNPFEMDGLRNSYDSVTNSLISFLETCHPFTLYVNNSDSITRHIIKSHSSSVNYAIKFYWRNRGTFHQLQSEDNMDYDDSDRNNATGLASGLNFHQQNKVIYAQHQSTNIPNHDDSYKNHPGDLVNILFRVAAENAGHAFYDPDKDLSDRFFDPLFLVNSHFSVYKGEISLKKKRKFYQNDDWSHATSSSESTLKIKAVLAVHPEEIRPDVRGSCFCFLGSRNSKRHHRHHRCRISYLFLLPEKPMLASPPEKHAARTP